MKERLEKIKKHFREYKIQYAVAVGILIGMATEHASYNYKNNKKKLKELTEFTDYESFDATHEQLDQLRANDGGGIVYNTDFGNYALLELKD
jgi:hypothetical protein